MNGVVEAEEAVAVVPGLLDEAENLTQRLAKLATRDRCLVSYLIPGSCCAIDETPYSGGERL